MDDADDLPPFELAYPGPLRDKLVAAVLSGAKTSTSSLLVEYEDDAEPLPVVGQRYRLVDSSLDPVGVVETTEVRLVPIGGIDLAFAREEGEGYESVAAWREAHERFWYANVPDLSIDESTVVVAERFRLRRRLRCEGAQRPSLETNESIRPRRADRRLRCEGAQRPSLETNDPQARGGLVSRLAALAPQPARTVG